MTIMSNNIVESKGLSEAFGVGGMELVHGLLDDGAGRGGIEAHEAFAGAAEHGAVVEGEVGVVDHEAVEFVDGEAEGAAVEEDEVGGFGTDHADAGGVGREVLLHVVDVALDVGEALVEPLGAVAVGGGDADEGEEVAEVEFAVVEELGELLTQGGIGDDAVTAGETGHVEGFAGAGEGDAILRSDFADGGEGDVMVAGEGEVGMDLIADHDDALALTDVGHAGEFVARPDAPSGVVG